MWDWLNNGRWGKGNRDHQSWNAWLHVRLTSTLVDVVTTKKMFLRPGNWLSLWPVLLHAIFSFTWELDDWKLDRHVLFVFTWPQRRLVRYVCISRRRQCCLLLYTWMHWRGTLPYGCHHRLLIWRAAALQSSWKQVEARHVSRVTITEAHR